MVGRQTVGTLHRKDLKPKREISDARFLAAAQAQATRAAHRLERTQRAEQTLQEIARLERAQRMVRETIELVEAERRAG